MPHEDGLVYYPVVATVSLGADIVLDIYPKKNDDECSKEEEEEEEEEDKPKFRILQERRSLLVTRKKMYTDFLHGIAEVDVDHGLDRKGICNWDLLREETREMLSSTSGSGSSRQRETRTSLTYRDVRNVVKLGNTMKFLGRR